MSVWLILSFAGPSVISAAKRDGLTIIFTENLIRAWGQALMN